MNTVLGCQLSDIRGFAFDIFEDGVEVEVGSGYQSGQGESCLSLNFSPSIFFLTFLPLSLSS